MAAFDDDDTLWAEQLLDARRSPSTERYNRVTPIQPAVATTLKPMLPAVESV